MKKLTEQKLKKFNELLYEIEMKTGLFSLQEIDENTDISKYIDNFISEMKEYNYNYKKMYSLNESTNKSYLEMMYEFR